MYLCPVLRPWRTYVPGQPEYAHGPRTAYREAHDSVIGPDGTALTSRRSRFVRIARRRRKTRFWLLAQTYHRRDLHPQGSNERFP